MAKYRCLSPECANKPPFDGPKGLNRCLYCGAADPKPIRGFTKTLLVMFLLLGLAALVWCCRDEGCKSCLVEWIPTDTDSLVTDTTGGGDHREGPVDRCKLVGIGNASTDPCQLQLMAQYPDSCAEDDTIEYRDMNSSSDWSELHAGSFISMVGKRDVKIEYRINGGEVNYVTFISECKELSESELNDRKNEVEKSIEDFLNAPISNARYRAFEKTKMVPNGEVILPDGSKSSGLRWQMDVYMLWPDEKLNVEVELDEFGVVQRIRLNRRV